MEQKIKPNSKNRICTICGMKVSSSECAKHLMQSHRLHNVYVPNYFRSVYRHRQKAHPSWYRENVKENPFPCGSKLHDKPFERIKIVYNPVATNRRRH